MPVRDVPPPHKKRKVEPSSTHNYQYKTASEIRRVFKAQSEGGLVEGANIWFFTPLVLDIMVSRRFNCSPEPTYGQAK